MKHAIYWVLAYLLIGYIILLVTAYWQILQDESYDGTEGLIIVLGWALGLIAAIGMILFDEIPKTVAKKANQRKVTKAIDAATAKAAKPSEPFATVKL